jgi:thioredoxin 1
MLTISMLDGGIMSVMELNMKNFDDTTSKGVVLVDFWAPWCGPCRMLGPTIEEISNNADGFIVGKLNVDENPDIAEKYDIRSIPTILIFKNGQVAETNVGLVTKTALLQKIEKIKTT